MGAHLSTVHGTVMHKFKKHDEAGKGYLTLKELMAFQTTYGINPSHIGVLYQIDKNHDGQFTLDELHAFASFAHSYSRVSNHSLDASYMTSGLASLYMWRDLRDDSGREDFVNWIMKLLTMGQEVSQLEGQQDEQYVHRKALKSLHVLFDMERNLGVDYQALRDMMQCAAEEQQLLDPDNPEHDDWVPLEILRLFTESLTDGMCGIMESFFNDDADEVLQGVEASVAAVAASAAAAEAKLAADDGAGSSRDANGVGEVSRPVPGSAGRSRGGKTSAGSGSENRSRKGASGGGSRLGKGVGSTDSSSSSSKMRPSQATTPAGGGKCVVPLLNFSKS